MSKRRARKRAKSYERWERESLLVRRSSVSGVRITTDPDRTSALACRDRARARTYPWLSQCNCWKTRCLTVSPVEIRADAPGVHASRSDRGGRRSGLASACRSPENPHACHQTIPPSKTERPAVGPLTDEPPASCATLSFHHTTYSMKYASHGKSERTGMPIAERLTQT